MRDALCRYRANRFTDGDVVGCTGLSERKWRDLIKDSLVRTTMHTPGRGRVRLCDAVTFKRAAVIAALNQAGANLRVSSQIAYFTPFHTALYEIVDPVAPEGPPPPLWNLRADWFDPAHPAQVEPENDWCISFHDGRFVGVRYGHNHSPVLFGDLREVGTRFVAWTPLHRVDEFVGCAIEKAAAALRDHPAKAYAAWEEPTRWSRELNSLGYSFEQHPDGDILRTAAASIVKSSLFTTTVNISLAIRKALRRYLGVEPVEREVE
jgi:hypothetical protein